ncbi:MAG: choice-of-anchor D domain-containing protein [Deltaproteobacteria bacterium]|nr:choice-of-anchor D domain-containing protein [Deltaproteobacteria bacterium]
MTLLRTRTPSLTTPALLALGAALAVTACSDNLSTGTFPRIELQVQGQNYETDGTVDLPTQATLDVVTNVEIINPGSEDLTIEDIAFDRDPDTSARLKNPQVELEFQGATSGSFPVDIRRGGADSYKFSVRYVPPQKLGLPLTDLSDSVVVIRSNARSRDGKSKVTEIRLTFQFKSEVAIPQVSPSNYVFTNATVAKPERQDFFISNGDGATQSFKILGVALESSTSEFTLIGAPSSGTTVLAPADPGYAEVKFTVQYAPTDDTPDTAAIVVTTDVPGSTTLRVPLSTALSVGSYSLSFDDAKRFDFTNVTQKTSRNVIISSDGPGPMTVKTPHIEPTEARDDYTFKAFIPATTAGGTDTEVTSWPRGLAVGKSIRIEVTFDPPNDGTETANGQIVIPYESPDPGEISIDLFSGAPKSKIVLAPSTQNLYVTGSVSNGDTGTRRVVVYNEGNGPLQLIAAETKSQFGVSEIFQLESAFTATTVPSNGIAFINVTYDLSHLSSSTAVASEYLELTYFDDFTGANETKTFALIAGGANGLELPVASLGQAADYAGYEVGDNVTLVASGSTPGAGTFDSTQKPYVFYVTGKPAGSTVRLNTQSGGPSATFVPDVAGTYTFELVVFSSMSGDLLYSSPATVTFDVAPAP